MKEEPNIYETIHKIEQMLEDKRRIMHYVHAGTLMDILALLKEQKQERESIKPTINEYGEAFCVCGENVGIIPSSKNLPSIRSKYCSECGRRMMWNE